MTPNHWLLGTLEDSRPRALSFDLKDMTPQRKQQLVGLLLGPLFVVPVCIFQAMLLYIDNIGYEPSPNRLVWPDPLKPWEYVGLFSAYGIPTAIISLAIVAPLIVWRLSKGSPSTPWVIAMASFLISLPGVIVFGQYGNHSSVFAIIIPHAIVVTASFVHMIQKQEVKMIEPAPPAGRGEAPRP